MKVKGFEALNNIQTQQSNQKVNIDIHTENATPDILTPFTEKGTPNSPTPENKSRMHINNQSDWNDNNLKDANRMHTNKETKKGLKLNQMLLNINLNYNRPGAQSQIDSQRQNEANNNPNLFKTTDNERKLGMFVHGQPKPIRGLSFGKKWEGNKITDTLMSSRTQQGPKN